MLDEDPEKITFIFSTVIGNNTFVRSGNTAFDALRGMFLKWDLVMGVNPPPVDTKSKNHQTGTEGLEPSPTALETAIHQMPAINPNAMPYVGACLLVGSGSPFCGCRG